MADSNEVSVNMDKQELRDPESFVDKHKQESDRVSYSRAISLYRASNSNSIQSSTKGTRWTFGCKMQDGGGGRFIFMPQEIVKVKYRVLEMVQATAYGDSFRI